jgi:hypothetical protein
MPVVKPKQVAPVQYSVRLGPALGSAADFWALAYCPDFDEAEKRVNPDHSEFTYVLRYQLPLRTVIGRVPTRLDALWQRSDGTLVAVGNTLGYVEITPSSLSEIALSQVPGEFSSLWAADDDHLFAAGIYEPFLFYCQKGQWTRLALPNDTDNLRDICGFSERDVYFVGDAGQVHHFDGRVFKRLRAPVRRHLTAIVRLDDTRMCIGGYQGTLMVGNRQGFRHIATNVTDPLLALGVLDGKAYYGADDRVWSTDGIAAPTIAIDFAARWVSSLVDGLVISHEEEAKLYHNGALTDLDLKI